jgi:DNA-binding NtrC family response regulator
VFGLSQNLISHVSRLGAFPSSDRVTVHCGRRLVINRMLDVLLVDDETHFLKSLAEGLRLYSKKLHVITADNGKKAVEILNTAVVDVVVTDLRMPCMDGYEFLRYMQLHHQLVPVIIMSACAQASVESQLKGLRFVRYIEKPSDLDEIAHAILATA